MKKKTPKPPLANAEPVQENTFPVSFACGNCGANWTRDIRRGYRVTYSYGDGGTVVENAKDDEDFELLTCPQCQITKDVRKQMPYALGTTTDTRDDLD